MMRPPSELENAGEWLRLVANALPALVSFIDKDLRYQFVNAAYEKWFDRSGETTVGKTMNEVLGESAVAALRPMIDRALAGEQVHFETEVPYKAGGTRWVEGTYVPSVEGFAVIVNDITERKLSEQRLRASEQKFATMFELTPIALALVKAPSGEFAYVNAAWTELTGVSREEALGKTSVALGLVNDTRDREALYEVFNREGSVRGFPISLNTRSGTRHLLCNMDLLVLEDEVDPAARFVLATLDDVTEQKMAQGQLAAGEERLRLALDAAKMGVYERDLTTGVVTWSSQAKTILGYRPGQLDESFDAFLSRIDAIDRERFRNEAMQAAREGRSVDIEYRFLRPDGQLRWLHAYGKGVLGGDGKSIKAIGVLQDITDKKQAEERLRLSESTVSIERNKLHNLLLQAPAIFSVLRGPDHVFEIFNDEAKKVVGGRDCTGLPMRLAFPELEGREILEILDQIYATGEPRHFKEQLTELVQPDGSKVPYYLNIVYHPWRDVDGNVAGIMNVTLDVTEQVLARKRLEEALRARDEFLSIASHELKTPLTSLKLQAQMRKKATDRRDEALLSWDRLKRLFEGDLRQINRLSRLINDMFDISRISTGRLALESEALDFCEVVEDVIERYRPQFEDVRCALEFRSCEPVKGTWDRDRIEQVIENLLMNALKYGATQPVLVTLQNLGQSVRLTIKDQGIGIAKEDQARVFERFERAISANEVSGLGLGLYIARHIVEMHDGTIRLESEPGKGSTFVVELPTSPPARQSG